MSSNSHRPLIGITKSENNGWLSFKLISLGILLAGGKPIALTAKKPGYDLPIQGLVLAGGKDIFPSIYQGQEKPNYPYDKARDELEIKWFAQSQKANLPILGICRGAQLINVARKGNLHFDVMKAYEKAQYPSGLLAKIFYRKSIKVSKDSLLYTILGVEKTQVNSSHTQSIDALGSDLTITSMEENKVVQSIEDQSASFLLGVQFHPEYLIYSKKFRNIFYQFVKQVKSESVNR